MGIQPSAAEQLPDGPSCCISCLGAGGIIAALLGGSEAWRSLLGPRQGLRMVTKDSDHPWRALFPRGCGSPCPRELGTWDGETPTHPSLQTILPSEWLAHHAEKLKEQMAPLADRLAPCGLIVSHCRP